MATVPPTDLETTIVPHIEWDDFLSRFQWRQGEHVTLVGANGRGKTTLELAILPRRDYIVFLSTKREDSTQNALTRKYGYEVTADPDAIIPEVGARWVLRPPWPKGASVAQIKRVHRTVFQRMLMKGFQQGRWTIVCDEVRYLTDYLGLADECELLWLQGRSLKVTMLAGTQRPRHIPLEAYSQARHLFLWHTPDGGDVARIAELASVNREIVAQVVPQLQGHNVLYVHPESGTMLTTLSPPPD